MTRSLFTKGLIGGLLFSALLFFAPVSAEAGTCAVFCRPTLVGSDITRTAGRSCTQASDCENIDCPALYSRASDDEVRTFCRDGINIHGWISAWCNDFLNISSSGMRRERFLGRCAVPYTGEDEVRPELRVSDEPAPAPAQEGDQFRCRYLCASETAPRDGGSCAGRTDAGQTACIRDCQATCGADACMGTLNGGRLRTSDMNTPNVQPRCIPVRSAAAPGATPASVGGIVDSGNFESINEVFGNLSITAFIGAVVKTLIGLSGALFLLMLLWAGFRWTTSGGDQKGVIAAQATLRNAVIGIVLVATSYVLVTAVIELVGRATAASS